MKPPSFAKATSNSTVAVPVLDVTAMDIGTSNTCVTRCSSPSGVTVLRPEGWQNPALGGAIPSLILYKDKEPFLIGAAAELEFGEATPAEKAHYTLQARFKPDIAAREDARHCMLDFLTLLRSRVQTSGKLLVGIPCQAENHYQQVLRHCLTQTGWEDARFLREPMGALVHYIASGMLPPSLAARGVLTVDFGGGTCDLAVMRRADVLSWHGDMLYGGRLFDDLFYQLLLEHNPGLEATLEAEGNAYYVHWVSSRRAKEDFSTSMRRQRDQAVTVRTRWSYFDGHSTKEQSAYIENLHWEDFLLRAGAYRASDSLRLSLLEHSHRAGLSPMAMGLLEGKAVDLISWFEHILHHILQQSRGGIPSVIAPVIPPAQEAESAARDAGKHVDSDASTTASASPAPSPHTYGEGNIPPTVLLTGGSSAWPFVEDLVRQNMGPNVRIIMGDEPYADIAKGLAQYHILAQRLSAGRAALQQELSMFMEQRIATRAIHSTLDSGITRLLDECNDFLRKVVLLPQFARFREEGGPLRSLLEGIATAVQQEDARLRSLLEQAMQRMSARITEACRRELQAWFREKGIPIVPERLENTWLGGSLDVFLQSMAHDLSKGTLAQNRQHMAWAALFTGPSLAALSVLGTPLVAAAIGVGGLVSMKLLKVDTWLADASLSLPLPKMVRNQVFSDARLERMCDEQLATFAEQFREQLLNAWASAEKTIMVEATRVAREEINALDLLNLTTS